MTEFEENNKGQLEEFLRKFDELIEEYHPNIYLIDDVFEGYNLIKKSINDVINYQL